MPSPHRWPVRVYYEDTDFSGFVYHANYLRFLERGRSELLRSVGIAHRSLFEPQNGHASFGFVVRTMNIDFVAPAQMDDLLEVETCVREVRGASARMDQRILRNGQVLVSARVRVAAVSSGHATRFPPEIRAVLIEHQA